MDLHLIPGAAPSAEERAAVDDVLGPPAPEGGAGQDGHPAGAALDGGAETARRRRHLLLPALQAAQARAGWISPGALSYICLRLAVAPADAYGVASFYSMLSVEPRPKTIAHVCDDIVCRMFGAEALCDELTRRAGPSGAPVSGGLSAWTRSPCLGMCERAPAALIQQAGDDAVERTLAPATALSVFAVLSGGDPAPADAAGAAGPAGAGSSAAGWSAAPQTRDARAGALRLLRRAGRTDPGDIDDYRARGGYAALRRALDMGPEAVIREVRDSKLMGRGGAAFPTGRKWEAVARAMERPHYVVCNADESEPGTFKDRAIMEEDPFAVVEAMTIAGFATLSEKGYIYVRGEYPLAASRIAGAILQARGRGLLGARIAPGREAGFRFDIELRRGAGAYICGEETALFNSIEGFRGEPRNKPPYPVQSGLFGRPTAINNVETLLNVLDIVHAGGPAYASNGTEHSSGTKLFCLSGCVERPGVYEMPFGATLRQVIDEAGGVRGGRALRAVLLGGAAGSFVTPGQIDTPLTFEGARAIDASLGSGAVVVIDDQVDLEGLVLRIAAFFRDESCGQCVPCRVGTQRQEELLVRLASRRPLGSARDELRLLDDLAQAMRDASICGLGQTAAGAAQSAIARLGLFDRGGRR